MTEQTLAENQDRPMMELNLLLMLAKPEDANRVPYVEFIFPLIVHEKERVALLIPEPACEKVITNWDEMLPILNEKSAFVAIPYHPSIEQDEAIYSFGVWIAYLDIDTPALMEMLMLDKYSERMYQLYRHLTKPFELE